MEKGKGREAVAPGPIDSGRVAEPPEAHSSDTCESFAGPRIASNDSIRLGVGLSISSRGAGEEGGKHKSAGTSSVHPGGAAAVELDSVDCSAGKAKRPRLEPSPESAGRASSVHPEGPPAVEPDRAKSDLASDGFPVIEPSEIDSWGRSAASRPAGELSYPPQILASLPGQPSDLTELGTMKKEVVRALLDSTAVKKTYNEHMVPVSEAVARRVDGCWGFRNQRNPTASSSRMNTFT